MRDGFIKVGVATPEVRLADPAANVEVIRELIREAADQGVKVLTFPELCLTGYTCGDLFLQDALLQGAEEALKTLLADTRELDVVAAVGLPVRGPLDHKLYNCAAVIHKGKILGLVPKTYLPNYGEYYEARWFTPGRGVDVPVDLCGQPTRMRPNVLFVCGNVPGLTLGVELCEDLWAPEPPSLALARAGATLILNLSASSEAVGKADYRRALVRGQSARCVCGYLYADAGEGESAAEVVFSGHDLIAENGVVLAETRYKTGLAVSEVDVGRLVYERRRLSTFQPPAPTPAEELYGAGIGREAHFTLEVVATRLTRPVPKTPFVPRDTGERGARCEEVLTLAALGLKRRLEYARAETAVIGLSGGLDSTLALLITARAMDLLDRPRTDILAVTMPCFGTTARTKSNAEVLAERLGTTFRTIDIREAVEVHFRNIGQDPDKHDVTYENAQARERTQVLMDLANQQNGLVIGTGDLSELALGWCTYNGDQMSMYAVNSSIPKTLVRHLVDHVAETTGDAALAQVLRDVLDTPVSPELLPGTDGEISQKTEDLVGPYELHDFFLYYTLRWGFPMEKVMRLAKHAFGAEYDRNTLWKWLRNFYRRFFMSQFKRDASPNGPKVGSVALSPRGDWRMPSDTRGELWLRELDWLWQNDRIIRL